MKSKRREKKVNKGKEKKNFFSTLFSLLFLSTVKEDEELSMGKKRENERNPTCCMIVSSCTCLTA